MVDYEKVGKFIKYLREERGWSQEELAEKIHVDRTKITKIENAKRHIVLEDVIALSDIFKSSMEEIISGEKKTIENETHQKNILKEYLKKQNTKGKRIKLIFLIIFVISFLSFLGMSALYFMENYGSVRVYKFYGTKEDYSIEGIFLISKYKSYFKINKINNKDIENIEIYVENKLVYEGSYKNIIEDNYGYNSIISFKKFINSKQNIFIKIGEEKIYLEFIEDFKNDKFIYFEKEAIGLELTNDYQIPEKIKKEFHCVEKDGELLNFSNNIFTVLSEEKYMYYDIKNDYFYYQNNFNKEEIELRILENDISCNFKDCRLAIKIFEEFKEKYIEFYLK